MRISDVLRGKGTEVVTITPDAKVRQLLTVLAEHRIGAVVVSRSGRRVSTFVGAKIATTPVGSGVVKLKCDVATGFTLPKICGYLSDQPAK